MIMAQALTSDIEVINDLSFNQSSTTTNNENKESITLIWFDPNIGSRQETEQTKQELRSINDFVIFFTEREECISFIQSIDKEKIFLIVSGSKASEILPRISSNQNIDSIFIFCKKRDRYENLMNEYRKIVGIYINLDDLCESIKDQISLFNKQIQVFSIFDQHQTSTKDLLKESAEFLWFQLFNYVTACLPRNQQAKQQMIQICKDYYRGNITEMKHIQEFEQNYRSEDAIRWYSKQSFIYKLINKALRIEDIDFLYIFRFFIGDLSQNLQHEHKKILLSEEKILNVYRGVKLNKQEFNKLKENQGKLISTNGYLSTSRRMSSALSFAVKPTTRTDFIPVLFHIQFDIEQVDKNIIFADIHQLSEYPDEEEILFDLNACFQIESIEEDESLQIVKMNLSNEGQKITKNFIELTKQETEELSVSIVFGRLLCDIGKYDKSQKYFQQLLNDSHDEDRAWIEFNIGRALHYKDKFNEAREYYDRAHDRMMKTEPPRVKDTAKVLNNVGNLLYRQGKYNEALDYHQRALEIREKYYPVGHADVAHSLNNIALIFDHKGKCDEALQYHQRALKIREEFYPYGHPDVAVSLDNIGLIFDNQGKYDEALDYYRRALKIREQFYPSGHVDLAKSLYNIGKALYRKEKYDEALDYYQRALKIRKKFYSSDHVAVADSLYNIGNTYHRQGKYDEALKYYEWALKVQEKLYPSGHVDIALSLHTIGLLLDNQGKTDEALDYYQRSLEVREKLYSSGHGDISQSLNSIGNILYRQGKYDEALQHYQRAFRIEEKLYRSGHFDISLSLHKIGDTCRRQRNYDQAFQYYQRALEIQEKLCLSVQTDIAHSLNNMGVTLDSQGKYDEALNYHQRALEIRKKLYPSGNVDVADSLHNIGVNLNSQRKYDEALDYYRRSLEIRKKFHPSDHVDISQTLNNMGNILYIQGKYDEALCNYQQSLEIREKLYPSDHANIAESVFNLGNTYRRQRKYDEAFQYYQRALKILEKLYPSGHVDIAHTLYKMGLILDIQEKYDEALSYHQRALKIREKLHPSDHIDIAQSLNNIGNILYRQGKYDETLCNHQRSLEIQEKLYPSGHDNVAECLYKIANTYRRQKKYDAALQYYRQALDTLEKLYPSDQVNIDYNLRNMSLNLDNQEKYGEVLDYQQQTLKNPEKLNPSSHVNTGESLYSIDTAYLEQEKHRKIHNHYQPTLKIQEKGNMLDESLNKTSIYSSIEHFLSLRYDLSNKKILSKRVKRFYERQNAIIDKYAYVLNHTEQIIDQTTIKLKKHVQILTTISLIINIFLFFIKIIASILSNSLSIISSVIDSAVDLVSSIILFWTTYAIQHRNQYRYPVGRTRLEPVAIIILSVIMCSTSIQILSEAIKRLFIYIQYITNHTNNISEVNMNIRKPIPIIVMCITIVLKIILYFCCRHIPVETIKALAQDHRNDILSNSVALISGLLTGQAVLKQIDLRFIVIDPIGAIIISIYIIISWILQATIHIRHLTGITADSDFLKLITWIAINFSPHLTKIDMVKAFHFGTDLLVEVDIGLPGDMRIQQAHDIGTNLQMKLESLSEIERAFVHIDYEFDHKADEHKQI
ncbi:unnamed protein product [Rotaria sp. Silwood1]|nr:unnamed protein product [Rotaria sp. Silwood1]